MLFPTDETLSLPCLRPTWDEEDEEAGEDLYDDTADGNGTFVGIKIKKCIVGNAMHQNTF